MKYMEKGGFQDHPLMRMTLLYSGLFLTGLWATNFAVYFSKMNLSPQSVVDYYLGSERLFTQPRSFATMLEAAHFHLPMMALVLLMLTHLTIFTSLSRSAKAWMISGTFVSALLEEGSGWLVRFLHPGFAIVKILSFLALQALMGSLLIFLAHFLLSSGNSKKTASRHSQS